jgi:lipid A oxidase
MAAIVTRLSAIAVIGMVAFGLSSRAARAELQFGAYSGVLYTMSSDVDYTRPSGVNTNFQSVDWDGKPFVSPFYLGVFATYWFNPGPSWGFQFDYVHAKMYSKFGSGTPTIGSVFQHFEFTDGLNLLTAHLMYRWQFNRFRPFVGAGLGIAFPHVEITTIDPAIPVTFEYQYTGLAAAALAGIDYKLTDSFSLFTEYKLTYTHVDSNPVGGGKLTTDALTHHLMFGLIYTLPWWR